MTDAEILSLPIEELEQAIGRDIFGLEVYGAMYVVRSPDGDHGGPLPKYARDIVAAKAATDALMNGEPKWDVIIACYGLFGPPKYIVEMLTIRGRGFQVKADTEEEARARAALMAYWRMQS